MKKHPMWLPLALMVALLAQLACLAPEIIVSDLDKLNCEGKGGIWRQELNANKEVEEWCELPTKTPESVTDDAQTGDENDPAMQVDPAQGSSDQLITAHGTIQIPEYSGPTAGGGTRQLETPMQLSFNPQGGPVEGSGMIAYESWSEGCPPQRFEHTYKFTGSTVAGGTASGSVDIVQYIIKGGSDCVYEPVTINLTLTWEGHFGDGVFEGNIINGDGSTIPFQLTY